MQPLQYIRLGPMAQAPVRWLSPESIKAGIFNSQTDVFAYGLTLFELHTYGMHDRVFDVRVSVLSDHQSLLRVRHLVFPCAPFPSMSSSMTNHILRL